MNFRYQKFPVDKNNCPFSNKSSSLRTVIPITFEINKGTFSYLVLIDSGADYCLFHGGVGDNLGIKVKEGKQLVFYGTSGEPQKCGNKENKLNSEIVFFLRYNLSIAPIAQRIEYFFAEEMMTVRFCLGAQVIFGEWAGRECVGFENQFPTRDNRFNPCTLRT